MGRPNPHERDDIQVGARLIVADPASPVGGTGRGSSTNARPQQQDSWIWGFVQRTEELFGSAVHEGEQFVHESEDRIERAKDVAAAVYRAYSSYEYKACERLAVKDVTALKQGFLQGLLYSLAIVAGSITAGAVIGGIIGFFLTAGAGTGFGAFAGGEIGFSVGMAILDYLGIGALVLYIAPELPGVISMAKDGVEIAWNAGHDPKRPRETDIDLAAQKLSEAQAYLLEIVVAAALIWILFKSAAAQTGKISGGVKGAIKDPAGFLIRGQDLALRGGEVLRALRRSPQTIEAALKEGAAQLSKTLKSGNGMATAFAGWIETNVVDLVKGIKSAEIPEGGEGEAAGGGRRSNTRVRQSRRELSVQLRVNPGP